jgi:hypothetical protein
VRLRASVRRRIVVGAGLLVAFVVGTAFGQALDDETGPEQTQTLVRTLNPLPLAPAARETVTVTVRNK